MLDDSTDKATRDVVDAAIAHWRDKGIDIEAIRRTNRQGYKAGAMHEVHDSIASEFIAIFDADFLPERDFLLRTIPVFQARRLAACLHSAAARPRPSARARVCLSAHSPGPSPRA